MTDRNEEYYFKVIGTPVPQGRPRFFRRWGFVGVYDPKKSKEYKRKIQETAVRSGVKIKTGCVEVEINLFLKRPKKMFSAKYPAGVIPHGMRPDCDNYAKAIMDALNGIAWNDDGQVQTLNVQKWYHSIFGLPMVCVKICSICKKTKEK